MKDIKIPQGYAKDWKGKAITSGAALLNGNCECGIECCHGYLRLPNYNSNSGDTETYAAYLVDGEFVIEPEADAIAAIKALKAIVPAVLPTTPITNGVFRFNVGNSDDNIPYLSGNVYQITTTSTLVGRDLDFKVSGTLTPVVITSVTAGFTMEDGSGVISSYPHTVVQSGGSYDYMFRLESGTDTAPVTVNIGITYLGQPYIIRLIRSL